MRLPREGSVSYPPPVGGGGGGGGGCLLGGVCAGARATDPVSLGLAVAPVCPSPGWRVADRCGIPTGDVGRPPLPPPFFWWGASPLPGTTAVPSGARCRRHGLGLLCADGSHEWRVKLACAAPAALGLRWARLAAVCIGAGEPRCRLGRCRRIGVNQPPRPARRARGVVAPRSTRSRARRSSARSVAENRGSSRRRRCCLCIWFMSTRPHCMRPSAASPPSSRFGSRMTPHVRVSHRLLFLPSTRVLMRGGMCAEQQGHRGSRRA